jgi:hypothetical protein
MGEQKDELADLFLMLSRALAPEIVQENYPDLPEQDGVTVQNLPDVYPVTQRATSEHLPPSWEPSNALLSESVPVHDDVHSQDLPDTYPLLQYSTLPDAPGGLPDSEVGAYEMLPEGDWLPQVLAPHSESPGTYDVLPEVEQSLQEGLPGTAEMDEAPVPESMEEKPEEAPAPLMEQVVMLLQQLIGAVNALKEPSTPAERPLANQAPAWGLRFPSSPEHPDQNLGFSTGASPSYKGASNRAGISGAGGIAGPTTYGPRSRADFLETGEKG